jgi:eukaryotic-like serine/threonine-protein kinase
MIGRQLGPYIISEKLGEGGMGEVYRARDTRLDRTVAIKVLPASFVEAPDRRARFEREARAISALNHPHICTLHDVGRHEAIEYLVMEHLDGESLADRLRRGPLPLDQVLRHGADIAGALAAAHRADIVHRDLKPGNVMLTKQGVKLLDFGLAKLRAREPSGVASVSTRLEGKLTGEGTLLGTVPYMAPEQLEGSEADARSDIWALGTVLYEMATGKPAFEGKSHASLIGSILRDTPAPVRVLQPHAPAALEHVVNGCLEKDPDNRWQSARDVERELRWIGHEGGSGAGARRQSRANAVLATALVGGVVAGTALGWLAARQTAPATPTAPAQVQRLSIVLPEEASLAPSSATPFNYLRQAFAVSADETQIVYVGRARDGRTQLFLRRADGYDPAPVAGTEGGFDPFFSPDGAWIGFFTFDSLLIVSLKGGTPLTVTSVVNPVGGTWCDDGSIYFAADEGDELWQLENAGTGAQVARRIAISDMESAYPHCLPGSTGLLVTMTTMRVDSSSGTSLERPRLAPYIPLSADYAGVGLLRLPARDSSPVPLVPRGYAPQYAPSGHIVFARGGSLVGVPFDLNDLRVTGAESTVLGNVRMNSVSVKAAQFAITRKGSLLYVPGTDHSRTELVWVDRQGEIEHSAAAPDLFGTLQLSPDGRRVAVEVGGIQDDIYVYDLFGGRRIRVTSEGNGGRRAVWHPDGRQVVFRSIAARQGLIKHVESDAAPEPMPLPEHFVTSWSARGPIAGVHQDRIWIGSLEQQTMMTSAGRGRAWGAVLAPDATFVAYTSSRTGTFQVFVQPNPPTGQEWQVSSDFGEEPVWSRHSRELFFRRHNQWWSVPFDGGTPGPATLLFEGPFFNAFGPSYDVAPDGRFLMALPPAASEATRELLWVEGWTRDLIARVADTRR